MKKLILACLLLLSIGGFAQQYYTFIENKGQWPDQVLFRASAEFGYIWVEQTGFTIDIQDFRAVSAHHDPDPFIQLPEKVVNGHSYKITLEGSSFNGTTTEDQRRGTHNYFLGNDPEKWAGDCHGFLRVTLKDIYPGIDMRVFSEGRVFKYDFIVHVGADPSLISQRYDGLDGQYLENGRLVNVTSLGEMYEQKPICWTESVAGSADHRLKGAYVLNDNRITFDLDDYDTSEILFIDPELIFSTYSGSFADNFGYTATYDEQGNLYSGSSVFGSDYPTTTGAYQLDWAGGDGQGSLTGTDIAISKYAADGTSFIYSTYLGGSHDELPHSLICDPNGQLIIMGTSSSDDFPVLTTAYQNAFLGGSSFAPSGVGVDYLNGSDITVTVLTADGSDLVGSTFLGGTDNDGVNTASDLKFNYADEMRGEVLLDADGNIIVVSCTYSDDFPATTLQTALAGNQDGTVTLLSPDLTSLVWSSFLGGSGDDAAYSVDVASTGDLFVCGGTNSTNLDVPSNAFEPANSGGIADGFVMEISSDGSSMVSGTYFGSPSYDQLYFVELDDFDVVHVFGQTQALGDYHIVNAAFGQPNSGLVIAKFENGLTGLDWSTVIGTGSGKPNLSPTAFLVDICGLVYISGWGGQTNVSSNPETDFTTDLPVTEDAYQNETDGSDFYLGVLQADASSLVYGTFFGGGVSREHVDGGTSRFNPEGVIYQSVCAGCGSNDDFPFFPPNGVSETNNSTNCNNGVFKFQFDLPGVLALFDAPEQGCIDSPIQFDNQSSNATSYFWDFGDDNTSTQIHPTHSYAEPGVYTVTLTATNDNCGFADTYSQTIEISSLTSDLTSATADPIYVDEGGSSQLDALPNGYTYEWNPPGTLDDPASQDPLASPDETTLYYVMISDGECSVLDSVRVFVQEFVCGDPFVFLPNAFTPNDDQENDILFIRGENIDEVYLTIYNRWGEMVFETREKNLGWDGTFNGELVDPAVFAYYLEVVCLDGQEYFEKGNVTVIR